MIAQCIAVNVLEQVMNQAHARDSSKGEFVKRAYTEAEAAAYIGMSRSFLRQDRMNGTRERHAEGPSWIRIGRAIRYLKEDLDCWLDSFRISESTSKKEVVQAD